ncbi:MAG TPA: MFS transporter [Chitinophagaceae bacterium]|jgi:predicted MFS family arabinose efflux permease
MKQKIFTPYQVFIIAILAIIQFSIILDFMVLSPLGVFLIKTWKITPSQFGLVVSVYAISAGISGISAAGFADRFDRKKFLLFFYVGFLAGTLLCAIAPNYSFLLFARIITGVFGGVVGSISYAIISDLFKVEVRGRVMGFVQMAFSASQVLGIPIGLELANHFGWHTPFWMIASFCFLVGIVIVIYMRPVTGHLKLKSDQKNPFHHLVKTISRFNYLRGFMATVFLATGGFMLMPLGSTFANFNLGISVDRLSIVYAVSGLFTMFSGPFVGKLSDKIGTYTIFVAGSLISIITVAVYTNLGITPLWLVTILSAILYIGVASRMISSSALMTAVPDPADRGAFMSINVSIQQIAGGIASAVAGLIVVQAKAEAPLKYYNVLGYVVIGTMTITLVMMYFLNKYVQSKRSTRATVPLVGEHEEKQSKVAVE